MKKTYLGKSFYSTSNPSTIIKELHREFRLPYAEVIENICEFPEWKLLTAMVCCYEKDSIKVQEFLERFNVEKEI